MKRMTVARLMDILKEHDPSTMIVTLGHDHTFNDISVTTYYAVEISRKLHEPYDFDQEVNKFKVLVIE